MDEFPAVRVGLRAMLKAPDFRVVGEAATAGEAPREVDVHRPDVILIEIAGRGRESLDFLHQVKGRQPNASLVVVTRDPSPHHVSWALAMGYSGYLAKQVGGDELRKVLRAIVRGECIVRPDLLREVPQTVSHEDLTLVEREILRLVTEGQTNRQIAQRLRCSLGTVKDYVQRIIQKLDVSDRTQAAVKAIRLGLLD